MMTLAGDDEEVRNLARRAWLKAKEGVDGWVTLQGIRHTQVATVSDPSSSSQSATATSSGHVGLSAVAHTPSSASSISARQAAGASRSFAKRAFSQKPLAT